MYRVGVECRRYFQDDSIVACVEEPRDCVGLGVEDTNVMCRTQPCYYVTAVADYFGIKTKSIHHKVYNYCSSIG